MNLPEITLVIGIDSNTIEQLRVSWQTWRAHRPEMWDWPWIVFWDRHSLRRDDAVSLFADIRPRKVVGYVAWPPPNKDIQYDSQREKMLSGHVIVPAIACQTPWYMKLDTDALARPCDNWLRPEFFAPDEDTGKPVVYVANRWHYTKGCGFLGKLEDWGDKAFPHTSNLGIREWPGYTEETLRFGHARMCSWVSFYLREFSYQVAMACLSTCGPGRIPVPSQDTLHWYVATRLRMAKRITNLKKHGWSNHSRLEELRRVAAEIMAQSPLLQ